MLKVITAATSEYRRQLYGGSISNLSHGDLGLALNTDVNIIKVEHLSFFNKEVWQ